MSPIDNNGRGDGGYLIALSDGSGAALVPDDLLASEMGGSSVSEDAAMEWIAAMQHELATAVRQRLRGLPAAPPFDQISLQDAGS